jgi:hypothetical protein
MSGEECSRGGVVKLTAIVALNNFDGAAKLCGDKGEKIDKVKKVSDLIRKEKGAAVATVRGDSGGVTAGSTMVTTATTTMASAAVVPPSLVP